ncbi:MAG: hypothetical protein ACP5KS_13155, partial [Candidatus Hydrogenedens sp.]
MKKEILLSCIVMFFCCMALCEDFQEFVISGSPFKANIVCNNVELQKSDAKSQDGFRVKFNVANFPNVLFSSQSESWDWSEYCWLVVKIYNPERNGIRVNVRIDNAGADGWTHCITGSYHLPPKEEK